MAWARAPFRFPGSTKASFSLTHAHILLTCIRPARPHALSHLSAASAFGRVYTSTALHPGNGIYTRTQMPARSCYVSGSPAALAMCKLAKHSTRLASIPIPGAIMFLLQVATWAAGPTWCPQQPARVFASRLLQISPTICPRGRH